MADINPLSIKLAVVVTGLSAATYYIRSHQHSLPSRFLSALWSIARHWTRQCKSILSLSLSTSEQSIFEEEFKYLIVTSSLFNETPQLGQEQQEKEQQSPQRLRKRKLRLFTNDSEDDLTWMRILGVFSCNVIISIVIIIMKSTSDYLVLLGCLCLGTFAISYFLYRHSRHVQIRKIHVSALESMHEIISLSQESDAILIRLLKILHATKATNDQQLQPLGVCLSSHFETYVEIVQQLQTLIDHHNLSRLRDMYNINQEIPTTLLEFDSHKYTMDDIDLTFSVIGWKRREYLLYLLALDVMSNNRTAHYGKNWRQAIQANAGLVREYNDFNQKINSISITLSSCLPEKTESTESNKTVSSTSSYSSFADTSEGSLSDGRTLTLMHRVSAVEKHIEDIQAKLFLCKQDTRLLSYGRVPTFSLERLSKRFNNIDDTMNNLLNQWEESKHSLNALLEDEQLKLKTSSVYLPSPPTSPGDFRQQWSEESDSTNDSSSMTNLRRSRSFSGGTKTSSFTKNRLHRIQSLKINRNNHQRLINSEKNVTDITLSPINTTL